MSQEKKNCQVHLEFALLACKKVQMFTSNAQTQPDAERKTFRFSLGVIRVEQEAWERSEEVITGGCSGRGHGAGGCQRGGNIYKKYLKEYHFGRGNIFKYSKQIIIMTIMSVGK